MRPDVGSRTVPARWSFKDFVLVWLGGLLGGLLLGAIGLAIGSTDWSIVLALAGGMAGNVAALLLLSRRKTDPDLGLILEFGDLAYLGLGVAMQLALAIALQPLADLLFPDGGPPQDVAQELVSPDTKTFVKVAIVVAAIFLAPVIEELVYRGVLLKALIERSRPFIIVATAAVFAGVHLVTLTGPFLSAAALVLPPLFLLGAFLAWLTLRTGRLGPAIFTHTGFNALSALVLFLPPELFEAVG